jgi:hypothetical protein
MTIRKAWLLLVGAVVVASLNGCATAQLGVEPWERELLAKESMQLDNNAARNGNDDHLYFSKEAANGGSGFGGGGCGCN